MGLGLVWGIVSRRWCVDTSGFKVYNYRKSTTALSLQKRKSQKEGNAMKALLMFLVAACVLALPAAVYAGGCHYHGSRLCCFEHGRSAYGGYDDGYRNYGDSGNLLEYRLESAAADGAAGLIRTVSGAVITGAQQRMFQATEPSGKTGCQPHDVECRRQAGAEAGRLAGLSRSAAVAEQEAYLQALCDAHPASAECRR